MGASLEEGGVVGPREQGLAAALDVEHEVTIDDDHKGTGLTGRLMAFGGG